jgi:hypothetical protein
MRRYQLEHEIMIIRRLAAAIKNQDWFTVSIEFVIVVAGIFVGLQVNDWNENRLNRAQERANLVRLLDEAENSLAYIEGMVEGVTIIIGAQRQLLEIMSSDGPLPIDTTAAEFAAPCCLRRIGGYWGLKVDPIQCYSRERFGLLRRAR